MMLAKVGRIVRVLYPDAVDVEVSVGDDGRRITVWGEQAPSTEGETCYIIAETHDLMRRHPMDETGWLELIETMLPEPSRSWRVP